MTTRLMSWPAAADAVANAAATAAAKAATKAGAERQNLPMEAIGLLGGTADQDGTAARVDADVVGR